MVHRVINNIELSPGVFLLRLSRQDLSFRSGQHLLLSLPGTPLAREYSIASGTADPWLDVLVRVVKGGAFSPRLARLRAGQEVQVSGPCGFFTPSEGNSARVLLATGTGVAPFRSFFRSGLAQASYLAHGVRTVAETTWFDDWQRGKYVRCVSRDEGGDFKGRVTEWMKVQARAHLQKEWWLCGNSLMIQQAWDILMNLGVDPESIHTEVYF